MTKRFQTLLSLTILCLFLTPGLATAEILSAGVAFTETGTRGHADNGSRMIGWQFTVGADSILVQQLGFQDFGDNGLSESHEVGIWRLSDQVLMGSVVVPSGTAGTLAGHFRYATLASPFTLTAETTYLISGFDSGIDPHVWDAEIGGYPYNEMDVTGFSVNPAITIGGPGTAHGPYMADFGFPTSTIPDARSALLGPNLLFTAVPEPSTLALLSVLAAMGLVAVRTKKG